MSALEGVHFLAALFNSPDTMARVQVSADGGRLCNAAFFRFAQAAQLIDVARAVCVCVHSPPLPYRLSCQYCTKTPNTLWPLKSVAAAAAFFLSTISVSALHVLIVKAENGYYHIVDLTCS